MKTLKSSRLRIGSLGSMKRIPNARYRKILAVMPIACVDFVLTSRGAFLLGKRTHHPAKGRWWIPGGRVFKGESLERAVARKVKEEIGIPKFIVKKQLWTKGLMFKKSFQGPPSHTVSTVYLIEAPSRAIGKGDAQHDAFRWFTRIDKHWDPFIKGSLKKAGFK